MTEDCAFNRSLITDLNDDCLYNIFRRLSVRDQLHLVKTCIRFRFIVKQMIWRNLFRETCTNSADMDELNYSEYQDVFRHTTEFMEKLTVATNRHLVFQNPLIPQLSFKFPRLTSFKSNDGRLHDDLMRLLAEKCPQLQRLDVCSRCVTGAHIKNMRNLQELYLPYCSLTTEHLSDIIECCANLTRLNVSGFRNFRSALGNKKLPKLRYLQLSEEAALGGSFKDNFEYEHFEICVCDLKLWRDY